MPQSAGRAWRERPGRQSAIRCYALPTNNKLTIRIWTYGLSSVVFDKYRQAAGNHVIHQPIHT
jgi:hypothetical protein